MSVSVLDPVNPDIECTICTCLVENARQSPCCACLYCKECIETWIITQKKTTCPQCRATLTLNDVQIDAYRERLSMNFNRRCKYYEGGECPFIGNRATMFEHEANCPNIPLIAILEKKIQALESSILRLQTDVESKQATILRLEIKVEVLEECEETNSEGLHIQRKLIKTHMDFPIFGLHVINRTCVVISFVVDDYDYEFLITFPGSYVSLSLHRLSPEANQINATIILIHPTDKNNNAKFNVSPPWGDSDIVGCNEWMSRIKFNTYVTNNRIAVGIRI
jgi:hypothetical protein